MHEKRSPTHWPSSPVNDIKFSNPAPTLVAFTGVTNAHGSTITQVSNVQFFNHNRKSNQAQVKV